MGVRHFISERLGSAVLSGLLGGNGGDLHPESLLAMEGAVIIPAPSCRNPAVIYMPNVAHKRAFGPGDPIKIKVFG
jgi:hypothetical protein